MTAKSFTASSVKIFKQHQIFGIYNTLFIKGANFLSDLSYNNDEKL